MQATKTTYWDDRALLGNYYKGEYFYTISPIPFYRRRRTLLLNELTKYIDQAEYVFDKGCGDGWYINYFNSIRNQKAPISGLDLSTEMVTKATEINPESKIYASQNGINEYCFYDLVYSIAVLAHVENDVIHSYFSNVSASLKKNGRFIFFEQVAPFEYSGKGFRRRTIQTYRSIAKSHGFIVEESKLFSFNAHRFFERFIAKKYYSIISKIDANNIRITANSHPLFRALSSFFLMFDRKPIKSNAVSGWGNVFMVLRKEGEQ